MDQVLAKRKYEFIILFFLKRVCRIMLIVKLESCGNCPISKNVKNSLWQWAITPDMWVFNWSAGLTACEKKMCLKISGTSISKFKTEPGQHICCCFTFAVLATKCGKLLFAEIYHKRYVCNWTNNIIFSFVKLEK